MARNTQLNFSLNTAERASFDELARARMLGPKATLLWLIALGEARTRARILAPGASTELAPSPHLPTHNTMPIHNPPPRAPPPTQQLGPTGFPAIKQQSTSNFTPASRTYPYIENEITYKSEFEYNIAHPQPYTEINDT